jgi:sec-independent protein translocase protein TatA
MEIGEFCTIFAQSLRIKQHSIMFGIGTSELLVIALIVLLLFGGKKIPELMKGLGKGVKSFKDGMSGLDDDKEEANKSDETKQE